MKPHRVTREDLGDLLFHAEEGGAQVLALAAKLAAHHPETGPLLIELQQLALDGQIPLDTPYWSLTAMSLARQIETLLATDGRSVKTLAEVLDPTGEIGVDFAGLITMLGSRITRPSSDRPRLRRLRARLIRESFAGR